MPLSQKYKFNITIKLDSGRTQSKYMTLGVLHLHPFFTRFVFVASYTLGDRQSSLSPEMLKAKLFYVSMDFLEFFLVHDVLQRNSNEHICSLRCKVSQQMCALSYNFIVSTRAVYCNRHTVSMPVLFINYKNTKKSFLHHNMFTSFSCKKTEQSSLIHWWMKVELFPERNNKRREFI